ncbi:hypothetical protein D3C72_2124820 [compost metagenome]
MQKFPIKIFGSSFLNLCKLAEPKEKSTGSIPVDMLGPQAMNAVMRSPWLFLKSKASIFIAVLLKTIITIY